MRSDFLAAFVGTAIVMTAPAVASPTTFTYQGHLAQDGTPSDGAYEFEIRLLDNLGVQIGMTQTASEIVTEGQFSMQLDFGNGAFDSNERFLEISVRSVAEGGAYVVLSPNQLVTSAPVAQFALNGNEGPVGPVGPQGDQGLQGNTGAGGSPGSDGVDGSDGPIGPDGPQGTQGNPGSDGSNGAPGDSHWTISGSRTYYNAGNVGIGTISPFYPLHVDTATSTRAIYGSANVTTGQTYGVYGLSQSTSGRGVYGEATATTGTTNGVHGESSSTSGRGVFGAANAATGLTYGGRFLNNSTSGRGVFGEATALTGDTYGMWGQSSSTSGNGVFGLATAATGTTYGVRGRNNSTSGYGVYGFASASTGTTYGGRFDSSSTSGRGVFGAASAATGNTYGGRFENSSTSGTGVYGEASASTGGTYGGRFENRSTSGRGVYGNAIAATGATYGVYGKSNSTSGNGVFGLASATTGFTNGGRFESDSTTGRGVFGHAGATTGTTYGGRFLSESTSGRGVYGEADAPTGTTYGVYGRTRSTSGRGVFGEATAFGGTNYGVYGHTNSPDGFAGYFTGGKNYFEGSVGIGEDAPSDKLHVFSGVGESAFRVQQAGSTRLRVNANGGVSLGGNSTVVGAGDVYVAGRLGIGDSTPEVQLDVVGDAIISDDLTVNNDLIVASIASIGGPEAFTFQLNVYGSAGKPGGGSWSIFSDKRLKKNITSMTGSLDTISALRPVNFEYKSEDHFSYLGGVQRGFIAQEVQKVIPQWVNTADDGYFYLDQVGYEALIVDAIQELRAEKDAEIGQLRSENELLKARLDRLERMMALSIDR